jgi:hypothetical protein
MKCKQKFYQFGLVPHNTMFTKVIFLMYFCTEIFLISDYQRIMMNQPVLKALSFTLCGFLLFAGCKNEKTNSTGSPTGRTTFYAAYGSPTLDGSASDEAWDNAEWYSLDQVWMGEHLDSTD